MIPYNTRVFFMNYVFIDNKKVIVLSNDDFYLLYVMLRTGLL